MGREPPDATFSSTTPAKLRSDLTAATHRGSLPPAATVEFDATRAKKKRKLLEPCEVNELQDKYSRLKRKYFELEQKFIFTAAELQRSGERNVRLMSERDVFLERLIMQEQEKQGLDTTKDTVWPRILHDAAGQRDADAWGNFASNLDQAYAESLDEAKDVDPRTISKHVGPVGLKRHQDNLEEERLKAKRAARKPYMSKVNLKDLGSPFTSTPSPTSFGPPRPFAGDPAAPGQHGYAYPSVPLEGELRSSRHQPHLPHPLQQGSSHSHSPISPVDLNDPSSTSDAMAYFMQASAPPMAHGHMRGRPKRVKAHTVSSNTHNVHVIPRDPSTGAPYLPLNIGPITLLKLGEVCLRERFHTERYIYPVGYQISRRYMSTVDPEGEVVYICTILDGGDGPKFQITPTDRPEGTVTAGSASGAWAPIVRDANTIRTRSHSCSVSGPDYFGLSQNPIKHLLQELPGAKQLRDYVWQTFVEGGPMGGRHASVVPALPEELDQLVPRGAYYPSDGERQESLVSATPSGSPTSITSPSPQMSSQNASSPSNASTNRNSPERRAYYREHVLSPPEGDRYAGYPPLNGERIQFDTPTTPQPPQPTQSGLLHRFALEQIQVPDPMQVTKTNAAPPPAVLLNLIGLPGPPVLLTDDPVAHLPRF